MILPEDKTYIVIFCKHSMGYLLLEIVNIDRPLQREMQNRGKIMDV